MRISRRTAFILFSLSLLFMMKDSVRELLSFTLNFNNTAASQIVLIPFISAALIYRNREDIFKIVEYSVVPGATGLVLGICLFVASKTFGMHLGQNDDLALSICSLVVLWLSGFLLFYGAAAFKTGLFPLLFLVFCIPIPSAVLDSTIAILQRGSADMAFVLLKASGTPVHRAGSFFFALPDLIIEVAPECSGIRSGISLLIASLLGGHLLLRSLGRRAALLVAAIPILIFKNALRISMLSLLAVHIDKRVLTSELHREGGIPFFVLGLLLIFPVLVILVRSERKKTTPSKENVVEGIAARAKYLLL